MWGGRSGVGVITGPPQLHACANVLITSSQACLPARPRAALVLLHGAKKKKQREPILEKLVADFLDFGRAEHLCARLPCESWPLLSAGSDARAGDAVVTKCFSIAVRGRRRSGGG